MIGTFWGITTFFNPAGYHNKKENYRRFREASRRQGLKLLAVELGFGDNPFELTKDDADILIQRRVDKDNVLFQKKSLLNIGLKHLPKDCDKFAWLDCDIFFKNDNWIKETSEALDKYMVVQPFSHVVRMLKNQLDVEDVNSLPKGLKAGEIWHGICYGIAHGGEEAFSSFMGHGLTGYAWAVRRELFDGYGIYDRVILGGGDLLMGYAFHNYHKDNEYFQKILVSDSLRKDWEIWAKAISARVDGKVYYVPGAIMHFWHGDYQGRNYDGSNAVLKKYNFDPAVDIKKDEQGVWVWASGKTQMHAYIKEYFHQRKEEVTGRIAVIVSHFPKLSESFVLDQITSLLDLGYEVDIFAKEDPKEKYVHAAVAQCDLLKRTSYSNPAQPKNYDFILAHFGWNGIRAMEWKKKGLIKGNLITFFHGYDTTGLIVANGRQYYDELFKDEGWFFTTCEFFKKLLLDLGCPKERLLINKQGVDVSSFKFSLRTSIKKPYRILSIGRLVEKKGLEYGLRAVEELVREGFDVRYEIIGEGPLEGELGSLIKQLRLEAKVFLLGPRSREEVLQALQRNDFLLTPSVTAANGDMESSPVVIKEAMACGLAVVATKHSGVPELIEDGVSGCLVDERDAEALAVKLKFLIKDDQKRQAITLQARKNIEKSWDRKKIMGDLLADLEKCRHASTGIPRFPQKLPGTLWGITTFFNPSGCKTKYQNYAKFRQNSKKQGLKLVAVELAFGTTPFELQRDDAERLVQLRTPKDNILWQKERMLNIALKHLPQDCDKIAWVDCDVIFQNENWVKQTSQLLENYVVAQLFSVAINMPKDKDISQINVGELPYGKLNNHKIYGNAYARTLSPPTYGHTGYAWAARRSVFEKEGFFDCNIDGSGDVILRDAFFAPGTVSLYQSFSEKLVTAQLAWERKIHASVKKSVCSVEGQLFHLWHGQFKDRRYDQHPLSLKKYDFDPQKDIKKDDNGLWVWASDKKDMHEALKRIYWLRNEDGHWGRKLGIYFYSIIDVGDNFRRFWLALDQMYLNFLTFFGQNMRRMFPGVYSMLKKYFPDRVAGEKK